MDWDEFDELLAVALKEDCASQDATTRALVDPRRQAEAGIWAKADGVVCGLPLVRRLLHGFDPSLLVEQDVSDGDHVCAGARIGRLRGSAASMLALERTMLNILQRLSGIATLTARYVAEVAGTGARIYDTRKTTPGWRKLEKYAVRCGGGSNHRMGLCDAVLIKDNHLALMPRSGGDEPPVVHAVRRARAAEPELLLVVEVEDLGQLGEVLAARSDVVMVDNMTPDQVRDAARLVRERCGEENRPLLEASGGITLANVAQYAAAGADRIAVGALTHSAPALDISLEINP